MNNVDISKFSVIELKALAFDIRNNLEILDKNYKLLLEAINVKSKEEQDRAKAEAEKPKTVLPSETVGIDNRSSLFNR